MPGHLLVQAKDQKSPTRWLQRPRHERRVIGAARRLIRCERRHGADEAVTHVLRRYRRDALAAGYARSQVDDWTMGGCVSGWKEEL